MIDINLFSDNACKNEGEKAKIKVKQNVDTYRKLLFVSSIFSLVGIVYLITDLTTNYYANPFGYLDFIAVLLLLISGVLTAGSLIIFKDKTLNYIQVFASLYYLIINTVMVLFLTVDLLTDKKDFLIVFYNFVFINIVIYYNVVFSLITEVLTIGGVIAIICLFTHENLMINLEQAALILVGTTITQHYLRLVKTKSFYQELSVEEISKEFELSSTIDFLTNLGNRKGLDMFMNNELTEAITNGKTISVTMLDIDDFKSFNDCYSHMTGDICLKRIGMELNEITKDKPFYAFRYGGEEFVVIGIDSNKEALHEMNEGILNGVRALHIDREDAKSTESYITVSIGSSLAILGSLEDFRELLSLADSRLYLSKKNGKNTVTEE